MSYGVDGEWANISESDWEMSVTPSFDLKGAESYLRREFPADVLTEVRIEFRSGERHDQGSSEEWYVMQWGVQAGNEQAVARTLEDAVKKVKEMRGAKMTTLEVAKRIAMVASELLQDGFARSEALHLAQNILSQEARRR